MDNEPGIFLVPLAVSHPLQIQMADAGVLSRRIPDFLCYALNVGGQEKTALLEVRTPADEDTPPAWVTFSAPPDPDEALELVPGQSPEAVVTGTLEPRGDGLEVQLTVVRADEPHAGVTVSQRMTAKDAADSCLRLAKNLAKKLALQEPRVPWYRVGTRNSRAFLRYLEGLDTAAAFDAGLAGKKTATELVAPFVDALRLDPNFALAMRQVHMMIARGLEDGVLDKSECLRALDALFAAGPTDGLAAVSVGEQLGNLGEMARAERWLRLAVAQEPPPPRALEGLGIVLANRGDTIEARNLWLKGIELDGHPDFFAHLSRLAFSEGDEVEGWDKVIRGLRRISEHCLRPTEFGEEIGRSGILLQYLPEHLGELDAPEDVNEALIDLCGQLRSPDDRVDLGLCLAEIGREDLAVRELQAGLPHAEDRDRRDLGGRRMLQLHFPDFDKRFEKAVDGATDAADPRATLADWERFQDVVPLFWPCSFFRGMILRRLGEFAQARVHLERARTLRPDQGEILNELAVVHDELDEPQKALDLAEAACELEPEEAVFHTNRALFLNGVGRGDEAIEAIGRALELAPNDQHVRRVAEELRADVPDEPDDPEGLEDSDDPDENATHDGRRDEH